MSTTQSLIEQPHGLLRPDARRSASQCGDLVLGSGDSRLYRPSFEPDRPRQTIGADLRQSLRAPAEGRLAQFLEGRYFSHAAEQWVVALENDPRFRTVAQKVEDFERRTGLQRATYFNTKKQLKQDGQLEIATVPCFTLNARPPESPDLEAEVRRVEDERRLAEQQHRDQLRSQEDGEYQDLEDQFFGEDEDDGDEDE